MPRLTFVAVALALFLATPAAPLRADDKPAEAAKKKTTIAHLELKGALEESAAPSGLLAELTENLGQFMRRLDRARKDKDVEAVLVHVRSPQLGRGKLNELRQAFTRFRESGKKIYVFAASLDGPGYLAAAAADQVIMPSAGVIQIPGVRAEMTFYKGLLDKLGIQAHFLQMGKYKGAAEPLTRTGLSEESREQWNALVDDAYHSLIAQIAESRNLDPKRVRELVDQGLFTAEAAKEAGLIDRVMYEDELRDELKKTLKADELVVKEKYGKQKLDTDFSGFGGMMKMMNLLMGGDSSSGRTGKPKVAVVYAVGAIVDAGDGGGLFSSGMITDRSMVAALEKAAADKDVKAIVLRVNSPGGSALASDLIWRAIEKIDKPIVASMGDVAASGGYYISMGCDAVYAEPDTITGSIGVIGGKLAIKDLLNKAGVTTEVISRGKNSGVFSFTEGFTESERAAWTSVMQDIYRQFLQKAAQGRKLELAKVEELAQGRVWSGRQAKQHGLVDELGTLADAVADAKKRAGLKADDEVDILELPKAKSFFDELFGADEEVSLRLPAGLLDADLAALYRQAQLWRALGNSQVWTMLPYGVELK